MLPEASEPDPESASDLSRRAWELTDLADYAAAVEASAGAIRLDPNSVLAYTVRGWALEGLGEEHLDDARSAYEMALQLDATAPWPRTGIAELLRRTGSREEADRLYRAVADDVVDPPDTRPRSLEFRGWSLYRLGRLDEAIAAFQRIADAGARTDLGPVRPGAGAARRRAIGRGDRGIQVRDRGRASRRRAPTAGSPLGRLRGSGRRHLIPPRASPRSRRRRPSASGCAASSARSSRTARRPRTRRTRPSDGEEPRPGEVKQPIAGSDIGTMGMKTDPGGTGRRHDGGPSSSNR